MCDLPPEISQQYGIKIIPGVIYVNEQPFQSGVDLHPEDIQNIIREDDVKIKTGAPPPAAYYKAYDDIYNDVEIILSLHSPSKHTGALNAAKAGARRLEDSSRVVHFECGVGTIGLGVTAIAAAIIAQQIEDKLDLIHQVQNYCRTIRIIGSLESFKYLQRSGRIKLKVASKLASALSIKPVLLMRESNVYLIDKPRNRSIALERMVNIFTEELDPEFKLHIIGISHFACEDDLKYVEHKVRSKFSDYTIFRGYADPMVAAHTGPGLILLAFFAELKTNSKSEFRGIKINV